MLENEGMRSGRGSGKSGEDGWSAHRCWWHGRLCSAALGAAALGFTLALHAGAVLAVAECGRWALAAGPSPLAGQSALEFLGGTGSHDRRLAEDHAWVWRLIQPAVLLAVLLVESLVMVLYWWLYIKPTPDKYVPARAIVPEDLKGSWAFPLFSCCDTPGLCLCLCFCFPYAQAELWYRAGWLHGVFGGEAEKFDQRLQKLDSCCPGWLFFVGVGGWCIASDSGCSSCAGGVGRGGVRWIDGSDGGLGEVVDHRKRFGLPHEGFKTFCQDCCLWCWCCACVGTQEFRQIMALLGRSPLEVEPRTAGAAQVVGQPVAVGTAAGVSQANEKSA